jgi:hypothetical protein
MCEPEVIASIADLELIANKTHDEFGEFTWWRGHSDKDWTLQPPIWRGDHSKYRKKELVYMNHFQGRALCQQESYRMPQDDVEWLFLAQHYRLPTRILDWTESPLVALYFAVNADDADKESANKDGCLWALSPTRLNKELSNPGFPDKVQNGLVSIKLSVVQQIVSESFGVKQQAEMKASFPKVLALQPWESNERIIAQSGRFTLHSTQDALETLAFQYPYLKRIIIPAEAKRILREAIKVLGIQRWSIFPDLENLAKGLINNSFSD